MKSKLKIAALSAVTLLPFVTTSCFNDSTVDTQSALKDLDDPWQKRWWLDKVSRSLRYGKGISAQDNPTELLKKTPDEIVDVLMKDPEFEKTALDFSLFLFGKRLSAFMDERNNPNWQALVMSPAVITGARELLTDGNFDALYEYRQPLYVTPNLPAKLPEDDDADGAPPRPPIDAVRARSIALNIFNSSFDKLLAVADTNPTKEVFCQELKTTFSSRGSIELFGIPEVVSRYTNFASTWFFSLAVYCELPLTGAPAPDLKATLLRAKQNVKNLVEHIPQFDADKYQVNKVTDLRAADAVALNLVNQSNFFGSSFFRTLTNSSTNYNRKRAAFVLKNFFCDDLTPLAVELPEQHAEDVHASVASCQACHYKLDPMAGFFRNKGLQGIDFGGTNGILFDDLAQMDREKYSSAWKFKVPSEHEWNVGYVRSAKELERNSYGVEMEDLGHILATAPEVKQCLIKRTFEYFVSTNQAVDAGYLDALKKLYIDESKTSSAKALKIVIKKFLTSKTFMHRNPVPTQCYDLREGDDPATKPPCEVAFLLEKNCRSCHDGRNDDPEKNLSLTQWELKEDGKYGFPHRDEAGKPIARKETFQRIYDHMMTADRAQKPMPPRYIDSVERQKIVLWVEAQLKESEH